jgi:hypothetical protein
MTRASTFAEYWLAHALARDGADDFAIVEIADLRVKAALDRDLQIAARRLELEAVMP